MNNKTKNNLPQPTTNLQLAKSHLDEFGYCLVADALSTEAVTSLRTRLEEQAAAEKQRGLAFEDGGATQNWDDLQNPDGSLRPEAFTEANGGRNQRVWMLINKGIVFRHLLFHKRIRELASYRLGEEYLLSSHTANIAKPGGVAMDLRTDQWWMPAPTRRERFHCRKRRHATRATEPPHRTATGRGSGQRGRNRYR